MKWSINLGRVKGIKISVHWTFLILMIWVLFSSWKTSTFDTAGWQVLFLLAIFTCVVLHELGHALTASRYGFKTKDITLLPIGGVARMEAIPEKPMQELVMALMGPIVNVAIALVLYPFVADQLNEKNLALIQKINADNFLLGIFLVNMSLAVFNLLPAFPMDGGRVLRALLSFKIGRVQATRIAAHVGQLLAIGFAMIGLFFNPFLLMIAIFVFLGAQVELDETESKSLLSGHKVKEAVIKNFISLRSNDSLSTAIQKLLDTQVREFVVFDCDRVVGTIDRSKIFEAVKQHGADTPLAKVLTGSWQEVDVEEPLEEAYKKVRTGQLSLVTHNSQLVGVIDAENILEFMMMQQTLASKK